MPGVAETPCLIPTKAEAERVAEMGEAQELSSKAKELSSLGPGVDSEVSESFLGREASANCCNPHTRNGSVFYSGLYKIQKLKPPQQHGTVETS